MPDNCRNVVLKQLKKGMAASAFNPLRKIKDNEEMMAILDNWEKDEFRTTALKDGVQIIQAKKKNVNKSVS